MPIFNLSDKVEKQVYAALKQALVDDSTLTAMIARECIFIEQGGKFPAGTPKPILVISPESTAFQYKKMSNEIDVTMLSVWYAYAESVESELGLMGVESSHVIGLLDVSPVLINLIMHNRLNGLVRDMRPLKVTYPIPPLQWNGALDELRLQVQIEFTVQWNPFYRTT